MIRSTRSLSLAGAALTAFVGFSSAPDAVIADDAIAPRSIERSVARSTGSEISVRLLRHKPVNHTWAETRSSLPRLRVGEYVQLCIDSRDAGVISVWSRNEAWSHPVRIYPNDYSEADRQVLAGPIGKGEQLCLGDGHEGFRLRVGKPAGDAEIFVLWTRSETAQFGPMDIPRIPEHGDVVASRSATPGTASRTIRYAVSE